MNTKTLAFLSKIKSLFTSSNTEEPELRDGETEVKKKYSDNGNLELEEYFKSGDKVREVEFGEDPRKGLEGIPQYEGVQKFCETHFKNGNRVSCIDFYRIGEKCNETLYEGEKITGYTEFYETGEVEKKVFYENGVPVSETGFYQYGEKCSEGNYENGELVDLTFFYGSGAKEEERYFKTIQSVRFHTRSIHFYKSGGKSFDEFFDVSGLRSSKKPVQIYSYYETGEKKKESIFEDGKVVKITEFYQSGKKKYEKHFQDGKENGLQTEWSEDGKKTYEAIFKDGNEQ